MPTPYRIEDFEPLRWFASHWEIVSRECAKLDRDDILEMDRAGRTHLEVAQALMEGGRPRWIYGWGETVKKWTNYGFVIHDMMPFGDAGCPETGALLSQLRGIKVAALSLFRPGAYLLPHSHPEFVQQGKLTCHIGLEMAPEHCYLWTEGEFIKHETGKAFVFDGSKQHYAFNFSDRDRLVFYFEFSPTDLARVPAT